MIMLPNIQIYLVNYIYLPIEKCARDNFNYTAQLHMYALSIFSTIYFLLRMHFVDFSRNCLVLFWLSGGERDEIKARKHV